MLDVIKLLDYESWEEVPDEDLWEDGEIKYRRIVMAKVFNKIYQGEYKLMRRKDELWKRCIVAWNTR